MKTQSIKYKFSGFTFDEAEHSLKNPNGEVSFLNTKLYDLLSAFVENPHCALSADELIKRVWHGEDVGDSNVSCWISKLREKLGETAKTAKLLKTITGSGYALVSDVEIEESMDTAAVAVIDESNIFREIAELKREIQLIKSRQSLELYLMLMNLPDEERVKRVFDIVQSANRNLIGAEQTAWIGTLAAIDDHLMWTLEYLRRKSSSRELELAVLLSRFWLMYGCWSKGCEILEAALSRYQSEPDNTLANGLAWYAHLAFCRDDYATAQKAATSARKISRKIGNDEALAFSLYSLGIVDEAKCNFHQARGTFDDSLKIAERNKIGWLTAWNLRKLGSIELQQADLLSAEKRYKKSLEERERLRDAHGIASVQASLSTLYCAQGNIKEAKLWVDRSFESQSKEVLSNCYFSLGEIEEYNKQYQAAYNNFHRAHTLRQEIDDRRGQARALEGMARMMLLIKSERESAKLFGSAFAIRNSISAPLNLSERKAYGSLIADVKKKYFREFEAGSKRIVS